MLNVILNKAAGVVLKYILKKKRNKKEYRAIAKDHPKNLTNL